MTKPNFTFKVSVLFVLCFAGLTASFAQPEARPQAEPSYEVVLQVLVGSNEAGQKSSAPANLSAVTKKLNSNFSFSNYRLSNTYIGRIANTGSIEYKSFSNGFGQTQNSETPVFLEWSLVVVKNMPNARGQNTVQIQPFRFGARVPVKTANAVVNYETIGLTLQKISLPENIPTLVGTLPTTTTGETIFLVLTVKPVEE